MAARRWHSTNVIKVHGKSYCFKISHTDLHRRLLLFEENNRLPRFCEKKPEAKADSVNSQDLGVGVSSGKGEGGGENGRIKTAI